MDSGATHPLLNKKGIIASHSIHTHTPQLRCGRWKTITSEFCANVTAEQQKRKITQITFLEEVDLEP